MGSLLLLSALCYCCVTNNVAEVLQEREKNDTTAYYYVHVGVIYDEDSSIELECMEMSLSDFYNSHNEYKTKILLHKRLYPKNSVVGAAAAALYLLKNVQVKAMIAPTTSMEADFVIHLADKPQVPIISFSPMIMNPFPNLAPTSYYIHMAHDQLLQAKPICALIKAFGWREVVPIYVENDYESARFIPILADALRQIHASIPYNRAILLSADDDRIRQELHKLNTKQCRVFVVHMSPELASRFFLRANQLGMMEKGYVWILTTRVTNEIQSMDHSVIGSMQGAVGLKTYVPETKELKDFKTRWVRKHQDMKLNVKGLWAYDGASALAKAVEQVGLGGETLGFERKEMSSNFTDLDGLGVSLIGPKLLQAVLNSSFKGLTGNLSLKYGQLESSKTYQIVNLIGNTGTRDVGFWTPEKGFVRNLHSLASNASSLRKIVWPGDTMSLPTGCKIMKVGVPVKQVYEELVKVRLIGGTPVVNGFCIDVFNAVMKKLGYSGHYQFIPFANYSSNYLSPAGSYDDLVQQISKMYDIVVGDVTIIANRTSVDFTLPYTESGVRMVVPVKNEKSNAWVFLKPFTWDLWVASLCAFVFIAFVIWTLEHRINEEFRGPPSHQAGTSLFFSFSIAVFAQRENVLSNLTRFVVIIWVFVVLVLTQSYTASLTSMLTVQKLQPTVYDVDELIHKGASVGFQQGSFVKGLLLRKGFPESKLISYNKLDILDDLLSKGSTNGGIAAVFDELPYVKLFLVKYPSKYIMVPPTYKTDGFGFAFPRGSPLVPDVSRAILELTEGDEMVQIEKAWGLQLNNDSNSSDQGNVKSGSLGLDSFWGLFLIAGAASCFALFIFTATFLFEHRKIWMGIDDDDDDASTSSKIRRLAKAFQQRDVSSHTFRKNEVQMSRRNLIKDDLANNQEGVGIALDQLDDSLSFSARSTPPHLCSQTAQTTAPIVTML